MLKDNHINSRGSITEAVKAAKISGFTTKIEVECSGENFGVRHCEVNLMNENGKQCNLYLPESIRFLCYNRFRYVKKIHYNKLKPLLFQKRLPFRPRSSPRRRGYNNVR